LVATAVWNVTWVERFGRPYTLLADVTTLTIRSAACEDHEPVRRLLGDDAPCAQS